MFMYRHCLGVLEMPLKYTALMACVCMLPACEIVAPVQEGSIRTQSYEQRQASKIESLRDFVLHCDKYNRLPNTVAGSQPCDKELLRCKRLALETFESSNEKFSEKFNMAMQNELHCKEKIWNTPQ